MLTLPPTGRIVWQGVGRLTGGRFIQGAFDRGDQNQGDSDRGAIDLDPHTRPIPAASTVPWHHGSNRKITQNYSTDFHKIGWKGST